MSDADFPIHAMSPAVIRVAAGRDEAQVPLVRSCDRRSRKRTDCLWRVGTRRPVGSNTDTDADANTDTTHSVTDTDAVTNTSTDASAEADTGANTGASANTD